MATPSILPKMLLAGPGVYHLGFSFIYGMNIYHTFIGSILQIKALPRQQFGALQSRIFPIFNSISATVSGALLGYWIYKHPGAIDNLTSFGRYDVIQTWNLGLITTMFAANWIYVGPQTAKVMFKRHRLEKAEKKSYTDPDVSDEMKAVTREFGVLHGVSSLNNLIAIIGMTYHGLWIGTYGLGTTGTL